MAFDAPFAGIAPADLIPHLEFVMPVFTFEAMVNIALPLFIVTMAGQNLPGLAVLSAYDYRPRVAPLLLSTGAASVAGAPFGMPTINLAAITAALCAGPDAHADPSRRYVAGIFGGVGYVLLAALAGVAAVLVARSPPVLIEAVAGLALIGAFGGAMLNAVQDEDGRLPGLVTFLVTASGFSLFGIGSAFWGLVIGLAVHHVLRAGVRQHDREAFAAAVDHDRPCGPLSALPRRAPVLRLSQRGQEVRALRARLCVRRCGRRAGDLRDPDLRLHRGRRRADRRGALPAAVLAACAAVGTADPRR